MGAISLSLAFPSLPLADRRLGDKELIGKFPLGEPQLLPAAADVRAEGLFIFHVFNHPLRQGVVLRGRTHHTAPGTKLQAFGGIFPLDR